MSLVIRTIETPSYAGVTIRHLLSGSEGSRRLMALLPGRGYTVHAPLLHYTRKLGWSLGYDVLQVVYGFQAAQEDLNSHDIPAIHQESQQAIEQALQSGYESLVLVGKSLGTPMAATFANTFENVSHVILQTPIQDCQRMVKATPTLALIGTADPLWETGLAVDTDIVTWKVFDNLNHALELDDDVPGSIRALGDIMQACRAFLAG